MNVNDAAVQKMKAMAQNMAERAYCPYSNFPVGAAVLTEDNQIFTGCNVENVSFGLTICAERNAVFQAVSNNRCKIKAVVIVTPKSSPTPPCGACRQVIKEFGKQTEIFCFGKDDHFRSYNIEQLLPEAFGPDKLL